VTQVQGGKKKRSTLSTYKRTVFNQKEKNNRRQKWSEKHKGGSQRGVAKKRWGGGEKTETFVRDGKTKKEHFRSKKKPTGVKKYDIGKKENGTAGGEMNHQTSPSTNEKDKKKMGKKVWGPRTSIGVKGNSKRFRGEN